MSNPIHISRATWIKLWWRAWTISSVWLSLLVSAVVVVVGQISFHGLIVLFKFILIWSVCKPAVVLVVSTYSLLLSVSLNTFTIKRSVVFIIVRSTSSHYSWSTTIVAIVLPPSLIFRRWGPTLLLAIFSPKVSTLTIGRLLLISSTIQVFSLESFLRPLSIFKFGVLLFNLVSESVFLLLGHGVPFVVGV